MRPGGRDHPRRNFDDVRVQLERLPRHRAITIEVAVTYEHVFNMIQCLRAWHDGYLSIYCAKVLCRCTTMRIPPICRPSRLPRPRRPP